MQVHLHIELTTSILHYGCPGDQLCGAIGQMRGGLGVQLTQPTIGSARRCYLRRSSALRRYASI